MDRALLALGLVVLAVVVAAMLQRRRPAPDNQPSFAVPDRVDRSDFVRPEAPWLVVVFTARSCTTCEAVVDKARALESDAVATEEVEASERRDLHARYSVDAVPLVLVVEATGRVLRHFFGPVPTADLWAAVADARQQDLGGRDEPDTA